MSKPRTQTLPDVLLADIRREVELIKAFCDAPPFPEDGWYQFLNNHQIALNTALDGFLQRPNFPNSIHVFLATIAQQTKDLPNKTEAEMRILLGGIRQLADALIQRNQQGGL